VESPADYDKKEAEFEIAKAEVAIAQAKLEQARISKKQAGINLTYTVVTSPVDGVVIDRRVNVGQTVVAGMNAPSLFLLAEDLREMLVWAAVNEADIGEIHEGQAVKFSVDAYPDRTFTGKVKQIRLNASLQQNVVTYGVIVDVDNSDGKLLPYMTAKLQFEVARREDVVLVPNQALRWQPTWEQVSPAAQQKLKKPQPPRGRVARDEESGDEQPELKVDLGKPTVWVLAADGLVKPVPVETGLADGLMTEVVGGEIQPGTSVVTHAFLKGEPDFVSSFVSKVVGSNK
jgi:HlyD family secretion protein